MGLKTRLYRRCLWLAAALSMLCCQACDDSLTDIYVNGESDLFHLEVSVPLGSTRAPDDDLNEYRVRGLHLYFFRAEGHDDAASQYIYDVLVDGEFDFSRQLRLALPENALSEEGLFGSSAESCYVYCVANVDESLLAGRKSVDELKSTIVGSDFDRTRVQDSFAMDGLAVLTLDRSKRIVTGKVSLQRAAAKLTLSVDLPASIDVEQKVVNPLDGTVSTVTIKYFSRPAEMHVWISNGVWRSRLNTAAESTEDESLYSNEIYAAEGVGSSFTFDGSRPKYSYLQDIPFYSYPNKWDEYSPRGNCCLTLEIPWYYTDTAGTTHNIVTYYRLGVQPGKYRIERNTHYDMRVTVSRLGGTSVEKPVDMLFDWDYNMEWNMQTLPTDIKEIRYLLLNNNDYSPFLDAYTCMMENEDRISIPFNTSHPVEIESVELSWRDYRNDADRRIELQSAGGTYTYSGYDDYSPMSDFAGIGIDVRNSMLNLRRDQLHIEWTGGAAHIRDRKAINAYRFTVRLRHIDAEKGDPSAHATVIITQIPAIYITTRLTASGTRFINNQNTTYETRENIGSIWRPEYVYYYKGYVSTDDRWPNDDKRRRYWLGSYHNSDNYVKNKQTYILTISKFAADDNYIIADPRTRDIDNLNESGTSPSAEGEWTVNDNTGRMLKYYYPADRNATKSRFIAPQLCVASQWGVTYQISRTGAERRCASYQEDGRPAGRWRLPTAAEIEYICRLSNKRYIPYLFGSEGSTANYWCASGGIDVDNDTSNPSVTLVSTSSNERRAVRCVYDEWFWTTDTLASKRNFTWGDRPRSINGN